MSLPYPPWVKQMIDDMYYRRPSSHLEALLYGPISAIIITLFPPHRMFLVKPQGALRAHPPHILTRASHSSLSSVDSYNDRTLSLVNEGREVFLQLDFLLSKVTTVDRQGAQAQTLLVILEVKRRNEEDNAAIGKMENQYLDRVATKTHSKNMLAFLVLGNRPMYWRKSRGLWVLQDEILRVTRFFATCYSPR
ncbi:hypothetical protein M422DRAFT_782031 [Sphaerobolus stellatus SS14]|uniref:Unplaced genomic scaffold SPHSTscaffold_98, whole genome shotgun sequence n=1 Tax=Sphaerobolus stellatus (strain SS14) TaxID=990650 RepID=A0A0C9T8I3_SPHS4|nr:hypothetical protein M422DRAFT_785596 [Sphaerobolus stellatus SS14]KIJ37007.1 hypothetical protein M422DRAFT_782031 [Sphaerobolus stellatus SS14]